MDERATNEEDEGALLLPYPDRYQLLSLAVQRAYHDLRGRGYECYADLLCCQTCGCSVMRGDRYVFWHRQDTELADETGVLHLAWDGDGEEVIRALRAVNLDVESDGSNSRKIAVRLRAGEGPGVAA